MKNIIAVTLFLLLTNAFASELICTNEEDSYQVVKVTMNDKLITEIDGVSCTNILPKVTKLMKQIANGDMSGSSDPLFALAAGFGTMDITFDAMSDCNGDVISMYENTVSSLATQLDYECVKK